MVKAKKKKVMKGYYRPKDVNPNWYNSWPELLKETPPSEVLDQLCEIAVGAQIGASDEVQRFAKHIHACLIAAYKVGQAQKGAQNED